MFTFNYHTLDCPHFESNGQTKTVKAIIGPIRVVEALDREANREFIVISGCSMYYNCENYNCAYSRASRDEAKRKKEG